MPQDLEPTLPGRCYLDRDFFNLEQEHIFCHEWVCVGREEEIPNAGDYLQIDLLGQSILIVRTREGQSMLFIMSVAIADVSYLY